MVTLRICVYVCVYMFVCSGTTEGVEPSCRTEILISFGYFLSVRPRPALLTPLLPFRDSKVSIFFPSRPG